MNLERVLTRIEAKLDAQDERFTEFSVDVLARLAVLESKNENSRDGAKVVGWILSFLLSVGAIVISLTH